MNQREAKRFACTVAAALLSQEAHSASDLCENLSDADLGRVQNALAELSRGLEARGGNTYREREEQ